MQKSGGGWRLRGSRVAIAFWAAVSVAALSSCKEDRCESYESRQRDLLADTPPFAPCIGDEITFSPRVVVLKVPNAESKVSGLQSPTSQDDQAAKGVAAETNSDAGAGQGIIGSVDVAVIVESALGMPRNKATLDVYECTCIGNESQYSGNLLLTPEHGGGCTRVADSRLSCRTNVDGRANFRVALASDVAQDSCVCAYSGSDRAAAVGSQSASDSSQRATASERDASVSDTDASNGDTNGSLHEKLKVRVIPAPKDDGVPCFDVRALDIATQRFACSLDACGSAPTRKIPLSITVREPVPGAVQCVEASDAGASAIAAITSTRMMQVSLRQRRAGPGSQAWLSSTDSCTDGRESTVSLQVGPNSGPSVDLWLCVNGVASDYALDARWTGGSPTADSINARVQADPLLLAVGSTIGSDPRCGDAQALALSYRYCDGVEPEQEADESWSDVSAIARFSIEGNSLAFPQGSVFQVSRDRDEHPDVVCVEAQAGEGSQVVTARMSGAVLPLGASEITCPFPVTGFVSDQPPPISDAGIPSTVSATDGGQP